VQYHYTIRIDVVIVVVKKGYLELNLSYITAHVAIPAESNNEYVETYLSTSTLICH